MNDAEMARLAKLIAADLRQAGVSAVDIESMHAALLRPGRRNPPPRPPEGISMSTGVTIGPNVQPRGLVVALIVFLALIWLAIGWLVVWALLNHP